MRAFVTLALLALTVCAVPLAAQQPPQGPPGSPAQPPAAQTPAPSGEKQPGQPPATTPQPGRIFTGDAGIIFFPVKPDKVTDFEKIMGKLKEALAASEDPVRKQQAAGWKVFKAAEPGPNNTVLYVFLIDPTVKDGDYAFWKTLYEAFPAETQELYRLYNASTAGGQSLLNLTLVQSFAPAPPQ